MTRETMLSAGEAYCAHAGSHGSLHTRHTVLNDNARRRWHLHYVRSEQEQVRCRLAARHLRRAENVRPEVAQQSRHRQRMPQAFRRAAGGDTAAMLHRLQQVLDTGHGGEFSVKYRRDALVQDRDEVRRQHDAIALLDITAHRCGADAEVALHDLFGRDRYAKLGKAGSISATGDRLAIDQDAVAIED